MADSGSLDLSQRDVGVEQTLPGFVIDKVAFLNNYPILNKATGDNEVPTPGYLYQEISKITFDRGSFCQDLLAFLVDKLLMKSYHVKLKVLRVMRYVVENGHPEFRQGLRRQSLGVQQATKFSGPPDPLHGNAPYVLVRKEAEELSQILFDVDTEDTNGSDVRTNTPKITGGMGSHAHSKLQGFGNVPDRPKSLAESMMDSVRSLADRVMEVGLEDKPRECSQSHDAAFGQYKPAQFEAPAVNEDGPTTEKKVSGRLNITTIPQRITHKGRRPGVAGGGWDDPEETPSPSITQQSADPLVGRLIEEGSLSSGYSANSDKPVARDDSSRTAEDWQAELHLVNEIISTCSSSQQPLLSSCQVRQLVNQSAALNCDKLLELVASRLAMDMQGLRALQYIEGLLHSDLVSADHIATACMPKLRTLMISDNSVLSSKSRKVVRILEKLCTNSEQFADLPTRAAAKNTETEARSIAFPFLTSSVPQPS